MSSFCENLIAKFRHIRSKSIRDKIKTLKLLIEDDKKHKVLFQDKLNMLKAKREKALENRRSTINRKRKREDPHQVSSKIKANKRIRKE